jgi:hypothetical protein
MRDWCRAPGGECRHTFLSRVFDDEWVESCRDRCDVCRKENIAEAVVLSFEKSKLRMEKNVTQEQSENAGVEEDSSDGGM